MARASPALLYLLSTSNLQFLNMVSTIDLYSVIKLRFWFYKSRLTKKYKFFFSLSDVL
jgi:hypothetical protein